MPDTGAWTLVINEDIREKLGLIIEGSAVSSLADGKTSNYPITEAVKIQWKDRDIALPAVVVAGIFFARPLDKNRINWVKYPLYDRFRPVEPVAQTHEEVSCRIRIYGLTNKYECGRSVLFRTGESVRGL